MKIRRLPENRTFPQILYMFPWKGLGARDDLMATKRKKTSLYTNRIKNQY